MTKYAGTAFLLKISDGTSPDTYVTVSAQRATSMSVNNEQIDVTDKDDSRWKKLLAGGVRSMSVSSSGLINSAADFATLQSAAINGTIFSAQLAFGNSKTATGQFQISGLDLGGDYKDAQTYSVSLVSAGDIAFA